MKGIIKIRYIFILSERAEPTEETGIKANSFQLRLYNPRLGRCMSPDPYGQYHSPYLAMRNSPTSVVDPDGGFDICETCPEGSNYDLFRDSDHHYTYNDGAVTRTIGLNVLTLTSKITGEKLGATPEAPLINFDFGVFLNRVRDNINAYGDGIDRGIKRIADGDFILLADAAFFGYGGYVQEGDSGTPDQSLEENTADAFTAAIPFLVIRKMGPLRNPSITPGQMTRIQNAANRINKPITIVGSRAKGTAGAYSDWDYIIPGLTSKEWTKIKGLLPGSKSIMDNTPANIDIFKGQNVNPLGPFITVHPKP